MSALRCLPYSKQRRATGFTLIELVVVIVILGILAATALPKFLNLGKEARASAVQRLRGDIYSAANLVRSKCELSDQCRGIVYPSGFTIDGIAAGLVNGYPSAKAGYAPDSSVRAGHIDVWIKVNGFKPVQPDAWTLIYYMPVNGANVSTCAVTYREAATNATVPDVTADSSGC